MDLAIRGPNRKELAQVSVFGLSIPGIIDEMKADVVGENIERLARLIENS